MRAVRAGGTELAEQGKNISSPEEGGAKAETGVSAWRRGYRLLSLRAKKVKADKKGQSPAEDASLEKPSERLKKLREAVDKGGALANANFLAYLAMLVYFFVAVTSTTHEDLLRETPKAIPLLNIQVPLWWFFLVGPVTLALIHLNLLNQYFYHSQNVLLLDRFITKSLEAGALQKEQADEERKLPLSFALSNLILDREMPPVLRFSLSLLMWFLVVFAPLAVLLLFQAYFLAFHSTLVTWIQRGVLVCDAAMLLYLWQAVAKAQDNHCKSKDSCINLHTEEWHRDCLVAVSANPGVIIVAAPASTAMAIFAIISSLLLLTIPGELYDLWEQNKYADKRNIDLPGKLLLKSDPPPELLAQYAGNLDMHDAVLNELVDKYKLGLKLKGRDLRGANLKGAKLPYAELNEASLRGANLDSAQLQGAKLEKAQLHYARLKEANLETAQMQNAKLDGADLTKARLQGVDLRKAWLEFATLEDIILQGANLVDTRLQRANLRDAQLQRANLRDAQLQGADLTDANLQYANLHGAQLQGANLEKTHLQNATLEKANLQGADLTKAQMQGANLQIAQLQGANLTNANLQGANLDMAQLQNAVLIFVQLQGAYLQGTDLQGANLQMAQLQGTLLFGAQMHCANLRSVMLQGANMRMAELQGANLTNAELQGANMRMANLQYADLSGADLNGSNAVKAHFQGSNLTNSQINTLIASEANFSGATFSSTTLSNSIFLGTNFSHLTEQEFSALVKSATEKVRCDISRQISEVHKRMFDSKCSPNQPVNSCYGPDYPKRWIKQTACGQETMESIAKARGKALNEAACAHPASSISIGSQGSLFFFEAPGDGKTIKRLQQIAIRAFLEGDCPIAQHIDPDDLKRLQDFIKEPAP